MKQSTMEWIEKAEGDWDEAQRAYRARKKPNYDAACFHVQQCVEKYLKARLNEIGIVFDKTHNLSDLLDGLLPAEPYRDSYDYGRQTDSRTRHLHELCQ